MAIKVDNFQILHNMETEKRIKQFTVAENLVVKVEPSKEHEFLMTTEEVANGYGVSGGTVRKHRLEHNEELIEGKHFILVENTEMNGATKSNADRKSAYYKKILWTKRGIVRLGFFIKSERAKLFRDWAEDLVIFVSEQADKAQQLSIWPEPEKRKHNRLTQERLVDPLADVAKIDDKELRLSIVNKLINTHHEKKD